MQHGYVLRLRVLANMNIEDKSKKLFYEYNKRFEGCEKPIV